MCMAPLARGRMFGRSDLAKMAQDMSRLSKELLSAWLCLQERRSNLLGSCVVVMELRPDWFQPQRYGCFCQEMGRTEAEVAIRWSLQEGPPAQEETVTPKKGQKGGKRGYSKNVVFNTSIG